ncbi:hypothetical protein TNCV_1314031 [Trichonephila clavipes]|nr:hypothetical protein TNCV_1314031 [Trichonephila clavipes]
MDWPARSPDLNPIQHVWDFLGRRFAARTLPPVTIRELRLALLISEPDLLTNPEILDGFSDQGVIQETCVVQNVRLPSSEALPADRRLYEGYGDRAEKGSLDVSSNRS